jgi:hypothetical protein
MYHTIQYKDVVTIYLYILSNINYHNFINEINASVVTIYWAWLDLGRSGKSKDYSIGICGSLTEHATLRNKSKDQ